MTASGHERRFDHLIGAQHETRRDFMPECLRSLQIDNQLKPGGLLAACAAGVVLTAMMSAFKRRHSAASAGNRSPSPSTDR
jgi:hypothetical protein